MPQTITDVLQRTDWRLLSQQKLALLQVLSEIEHCMAARECYASFQPDDPALISRHHYLSGLLHWIDAIQDSAKNAGLPVVWLDEDQDERPA